MLAGLWTGPFHDMCFPQWDEIYNEGPTPKYPSVETQPRKTSSIYFKNDIKSTKQNVYQHLLNAFHSNPNMNSSYQ